MKSTYFLIVIGLLFMGMVACQQDASEETEVQAVEVSLFDIQRGTNISHWLSQSDVRGEERRVFFQEEDVKFLADLGFDHIRIPIDEEQMWNEAGEKETEAFDLLHNALRWSQEHGLKVIVDLHILRSHHFNRGEKPLWTEAAAQERFFQCWRELSEELRAYPNDFLAYELMNEPVADNPEDWNELVASTLAVVREEEPYRKVFIGSNRWQSTETFDDLRLPENDPHIVVSFHFYTPMLITHHQASWTGVGLYEGPVQYPGQPIPDAVMDTLSPEIKAAVEGSNQVFTKDSLEQRILKPVSFARDRGLQVYCGEWGCYPTVPRESFLNWYRDVKSILEQYDVAWTTWDYKGGFGIRDRETGAPVEDLIEVLVGDAS